MALTGFDPQLVYSSIARVQSAYDSLMQALISDTQSKFVNPMGDAWACNDAMQFFASAQTAFNAQITGATQVFTTVVEAMNSAARAWANSTKSEYGERNFSPNNGKVDVSCIKENIGGVRGIDEGPANSAISQLAVIKSAADSALDQAANAVSNCGFVGGSQESNLINSLNKIKSSISTSFGELTDAAKTAMDATVQTYGTIESNVSNAFAGN